MGGDEPLVVLLSEQGPEQAQAGLPIGNGADDGAAALDLLVEALERVGAVL